MAKLTNRYADKPLKQGHVIVDIKTGEQVPIEGKVLIRKSTGKININFQDYGYFNLEALRIILSLGIKQVELGLLVTLCSNLMQDENISLQENDEPHTTLSIAALTNQTEQAVKKKLNVLIKLGLLDYSKTMVGLKMKKVYRVNPYMIRKGKQLNGNLKSLFNDIYEPSGLRAPAASR